MARTRITNANLEAMVDQVNVATGNNPAAYTKTGAKFKANIGNYHISWAYGGVCLHQMNNAGGGINDVFRCGHIPKRELYNRIRAYLDGIRCADSLAFRRTS